MFRVRYRNSQGTLMRILTAISRRGLDLGYVQAEPSGLEHEVTLLVDVNAKQIGQLCRDWHATIDVHEVHVSAAVNEMGVGAPAVHMPPASAGLPEVGSRTAMA
jgi:acetolactate synthase small subunit